MILVTGATGHLGKATINSLLSKGVKPNSITALVRDASKAEDLKGKGITLKVGDYDNYPSLVSAFKGIEKLLVVSGTDANKRTEQHKNAVRAAKEAGIKHLLYTSFFRHNDTGSSPIYFISPSHLATELYIKESGIPYTIFRNNLYLELLPMLFGEKVVDTGIYLPAGDTKAAYVLRSDMAEAIANVFLNEGHKNKDYNISNSENVSIPEIADVLSSLAGKEVNYTSPFNVDYIAAIIKAGVPGEYVGIFSALADAIRQGEFQSTTTDLEMLLGRKPMSAKEFIKQTYFSK